MSLSPSSGEVQSDQKENKSEQALQIIGHIDATNTQIFR
jgi:predicted nucleic acid-binding protein